MVECFFQREIDIDIANTDIDHQIEIDVHVGVPEDKVVQTLVSADYLQKHGNDTLVRCRVSFIGAFECNNGLPKNELEKFGHINGAAIVFPFLREQLSSLMVKSGLKAIVLPPYNFVERYKDLQNKS